MAKLDFTKPEIAYIKSKIYLSEEDEKILDLWLLEASLKEMTAILGLGQSTISRRKAKILKKIMKVI